MNFDLKNPPELSKNQKYALIGAGVFFLLIVAAGLGGGDAGGSSGTDSAAESGSVKQATERRVTVKCKFSGADFKVTCVDGAPCPKENAETVCVHDYQPFWVNEKKRSINNWERDGHWSAKKDQLTLLNFSVSKSSGISAKDAWVGKSGSARNKVDGFRASANGSIYFVGPPAVMQGVTDQIYGVGRFREFDQGVFSDDMHVEVVGLLSEAEYNQYSALKSLDAYLKKHSSLKGKTADDAYQRYEAVTGLAQPYEVDFILSQNKQKLSEIKAAAIAYRSEELAQLTTKLEANAYERIRHLSFDWDSVDGESVLDEDWALKSRKKCANKPSDDAKKSRRDEYVKQITSPIFRVNLYFEDGKFKKKKKGFEVPYYASDFSLSGRLKHKRESMSASVCCRILGGQCDETPGLFSGRCPRGYVKRRTSMGSTYDWKDPGRLKVIVPAESKDEELKTLKGEALVQIKSKHYVCSRDGVELSKYKGVLHGVRVLHGDAVLQEIVNLELPTSEALKGREGWLAGQVNLPKKSKKKR